jgi:hypothetical protein
MERVKKSIFAGLAAFALAGGTVIAAAPAAVAATTQCGSACITLAPEEDGSVYVGALQEREVEQGSVLTLAGSGPYEGEDFLPLDEGTTTLFWEYGLVSIALAKNWPSQQLYEYEYDPAGQQSNLCIGTAAAAAGGTELSLQPCGVNNLTLWLPETHDVTNGYVPIIAGSDTRTTAPYVITAGSPGGALTTQEQVSPLQSTQLWEDLVGEL